MVACPVDGTVRAADIQTCAACGTRYTLGVGSSSVVVAAGRRPARGRRRHRLARARRDTSVATLSQYLFVSGALLLLFAFVAAVAFTTLLAVGRRAAAGLVAGTSARGDRDPGLAPSASLGGQSRALSTLAAIGHGLTWASFLLLSGSLATRAVIVGRGPWGNMYEFSIAFAVGILAGYLLLERRFAIRSLAFLPLGVALFLAGYAATLPSTIEPLVPALDNAPLLTVHVAMAMIAYGVLAISFAAAVGYLAAGRGRPLRLAARP